MGRKKKKKLHKKKRGRTYNKKKLKNAILSTLYENPGKTVNYREISGSLSIKDPETRKLINVALQELADDGYVDQISRGKFKLKARTGKVTGIIEMQPQGFAYVISDELEQPAVISSRNLNHAMEGDKVRIHVYARRKKHDLEGEVTEILERTKTIFVGTVQPTKNFALLIPSGNDGFDLLIPKDKITGETKIESAHNLIKEKHPDVKFGNSFALHHVLNKDLGHIVSDLELGDFVDFSYSPVDTLNDIVKTPEPAKGELQLVFDLAGDKTEGIFEVSWGTSELIGGSETGQTEVLEQYFEFYTDKESEIEFFTWYRQYDRPEGTCIVESPIIGDDTLTVGGSGFGSSEHVTARLSHYICSAGMINNDGNPKSSWNEFKKQIEMID